MLHGTVRKNGNVDEFKCWRSERVVFVHVRQIRKRQIATVKGIFLSFVLEMVFQTVVMVDVAETRGRDLFYMNETCI